jgi:FkbM family methyltransferase
VPPVLGRLMRRALRPFGLTLVPIARPGWQRLDPATVIDVGAAYGDWAAQARAAFPTADLILVEPLEEYEPILRRRLGELRAAVRQAVAAGSPGTATINVHPDLVGSSVYLENEAGVNGQPRRVDAITVDSLEAAGPVLLKVDAQGAELDVLSGAGETLGRCCGVLLELSLFRFFRGGPLAHEVAGYMAERGFVLYDVDEILRRPLDGAVSQINALFVPEASPLRREHVYARPDDRARQDRLLQAEYRRRLSG